MTSESQNPPSILKKVDTIEKLKDFLKKKKKSSKDHSNYDILFRHYITSETPEEQSYSLLDLFISKLDFNYQNQNNNNETPLMYLVDEGLNVLCEHVIKKNGENLELSKKDDNQENIFFKIINSPHSIEKTNLFNTALNSIKEVSEDEEQKEALDSVNSSGKSLIECAMNAGNSEISQILLGEGIQTKKNTITGDNLLHFAVRGKNPYCLAAIFNNINIEQDSIKEMIKETNKDNETPLQLAKKLNLNIMVQKMNDFISGEKKNKLTGENNEDEIYGMLSQLNGENTEKIVNSIKKNYFVSDWNKLFLEIIEKNKSNQKYDINLEKKICEYFGFNQEEKDNEESLSENEEKEEEKNDIKFPICLNKKDNAKINKPETKNNMQFLNYIIGV